MMRALLLPFLVLAAHVPLPAQDRAIQFRAVCFEMAPGPREVVASGEPGSADGVALTLGRRLDTTLHQLTVRGNVVTIGTPTTDANGGTALAASATAKLPASGKQFLFLLVPNGEAAGEIYDCLVLKDDRESFPPGGYRFVNFTPNELRFLLEEQPFALAPGADRVVPTIEGAREDGRFSYIAQYFHNEAWNRLSTGYWYTHPKIRSLQLVYVHPRTKRLALKSYDDKLFMRTPPSPAR